MQSPTRNATATVNPQSAQLPCLDDLGPTSVYDTYWRFAARRQQVLVRRVQGESPPWSEDPVLLQYRFTNAYRVCDRVSQFLVRKVIYSDEFTDTDTVFRILLMKTFNRIDTWEMLEKHFGCIEYTKFDENRYGDVLTHARGQGSRIYSPAYIMPSVGSVFGYKEKHRNHLALIRMIIESGFVEAIKKATMLEQIYELLRGFPGLGPFLAFQYAIDLNYSDIIDFDENEFVVAGPGALDGISKCFANADGVPAEKIIAAVAAAQDQEFERRGLNFYRLGDRRLQLIDCQNLFCEISKYARVVHPDIEGVGGRKRIKQNFQPLRKPVTLWFPPKWGVELSWGQTPEGGMQWNESLFG